MTHPCRRPRHPWLCHRTLHARVDLTLIEPVAGVMPITKTGDPALQIANLTPRVRAQAQVLGCLTGVGAGAAGVLRTAVVEVSAETAGSLIEAGMDGVEEAGISLRMGTKAHPGVDHLRIAATGYFHMVEVDVQMALRCKMHRQLVA